MKTIFSILVAGMVFGASLIANAQETVSKKFVPPAGASCAKATTILEDGSIYTRYVCKPAGKK